MDSKNAIIGDNMGTDLPVTQVDSGVLNQEQSMAKYSKSREYQQLKQHLQSRITYYQSFLPDGRQVSDVPPKEQAEMWGVANTIIAEFNAVIMAYEGAAEAVENATRP